MPGQRQELSLLRKFFGRNSNTTLEAMKVNKEARTPSKIGRGVCTTVNFCSYTWVLRLNSYNELCCRATVVGEFTWTLGLDSFKGSYRIH